MNESEDVVHKSLDDQLRAFWVEVLECQDLDVRADADFFDLGGSSITAVLLAALVQEHLAISIDAIEIVTQPKFSEISALVASRLLG